MIATEMILVRHGVPQLENRPRCYGRLDLPLSPEGIDQMRAVVLPPSSIIYTSPSERCAQSAHILAGPDVRLEVIPDLVEIDFGLFEGKSYDEISVTHPLLYQQWMMHPTTMQFPNGENFSQFKTRVLNAISQLCQFNRQSSFIVVAHGGVNRIVLAHALNMRDEDIFRIGQRYAAVNRIFYYDETPVVDLINGQQY